MRERKIKKELNTNDETISNIADLLGIFGDYTRCRIISCLFISPMKVSELASTLNMTISAISHSLRILKSSKVVKSKREGREITYSLEDDHIIKIFAMAKEHVEE